MNHAESQPKPEMRSEILALSVLLGCVLLFYGRLLCGRFIFAPGLYTGLLGRTMLLRDCLSSLRLPVINPYILCGAPVLEDMTAGALYPLHLLLLCGPKFWAFHLFIVAHYMLAAIAFYALLRSGLRAEPWVAATGALGYTCGGYLWAAAGHFHVVAAPWVALYFLGLLRVERSLDGAHLRRWWVLTTLALAMLLYCGVPQRAYDSLLFGLILIGMGCIRRVRYGLYHDTAVLGAAFVVCTFVSVFLAAPQVLPGLLAVFDSSHAPAVPLEAAAQWSFPPVRTLEYLVPFFHGAHQDYGFVLTALYGRQLTLSQCVYVGGPITVCALLLPIRRLRLTHAWAAVVTLLGLLLAVGRFGPVYGWFHVRLPGFALFQHPETYLFWVHFGVLLLGCMGLAQATSDRKPARWALFACGIAVALVAAIGVGLLLVFVLRQPAYATWVRSMGSQWEVRRLLRWQLGHCAGTLAVLGAFAVSLWWAWKHSRLALIPPIAFAVTAIHLSVLSLVIVWTIPGAWVHDRRQAVADVPAENLLLYRWFVQPGTGARTERDLRTTCPMVDVELQGYTRMSGDAAALAGARSISGSSPLKDKRFAQFADLDRHDPEAVMRLLSVRYQVANNDTDPENPPPGTRLVAARPDEGYVLLERPDALPRVHSTDRYVIASPAKAAETALDLTLRQPALSGVQHQRLPEHPPSSFPPVVLERLPAGFVKNAATANTTNLRILHDSPGRVSVTCTGPTWLVVRDWWRPGWQAEINGQHRFEVLRADGGLMAVAVPVGHHQVDLRYHTPGLRFGCIAAVCALLIFISVLVFAWPET